MVLSARTTISAAVAATATAPTRGSCCRTNGNCTGRVGTIKAKHEIFIYYSQGASSSIVRGASRAHRGRKPYRQVRDAAEDTNVHKQTANNIAQTDKSTKVTNSDVNPRGRGGRYNNHNISRGKRAHRGEAKIPKTNSMQ